MDGKGEKNYKGKAYKKREKALQRRISVEQGVNKRLTNLLAQCE